jgi:hypothetical protein
MNAHSNPDRLRLQSAVKPYIDAALTLVPLHRWNAPDGKGKAPRDSKWTRTAYDSKAVLADALKRGINVGVRPGSRFLIIDVDVRHGGHKSFVAFCRAHGLIPETLPLVLTGGGGQHFFVRLPKDCPKLRKKLRDYPGIDFLSGDGVQAVCAGSRHPSGKFYEWAEDFEDRPALKDAPILAANIVDALARPSVDDMEFESPDVDAASPEVVAEVLGTLDVTDFRDQQDWQDFMMATAMVSGGEAVEEFITWSTSDPLYAGDDEKIRTRWDSVDTSRTDGITGKSFYWIAREHGAPQSVLSKLLPERPATSAHKAFGDGEDFVAADEFESADEPEDEDEFEDVFILDGNDKIKATSQHNVRLALDMLGASVSYNQFSDRILIEGLKSFGPYLDDAALDRLWLKVDEEFHFRPSRAFFDTVVTDYARRRSFHPVRDYFDKAQAAWDGEPRIDRLLIDYAGAEDSPYMRAVSALPLIATVRRVRQPGAKYDEAVVMESIQGKLKSTFLATLAITPEWFTDSLPLHANQKETIEFTSGKLIVEFADLHGLKKADIDQVKAQLSRTADRARLAYGKLPVERPRQWIPWGTANNDTYLRDQTGNRRFWPAKINHCDIPKLKADLQQLWGEAATREAAGASIRLPPALYGAATVEQEKRLDTKADPFTDTLAHMLGDIEGKITGENVWQILGMNVPGLRTQHHNERMGAAMRYLGWKRGAVRSGGRKRPGYVKGGQPLREVFVHGERGDVRVSHDKDDGVEFDG